MEVRWIISEAITSEQISPEIINNTGPSWGSWVTWHKYKTNNCICSDLESASRLVEQSFQNTVNLYISKDSFQNSKNPQGVHVFDGHFVNSSISNKDDIVALNIAVPAADIVLLLGFNFSPLLNTDDEALRESRAEYYFNVRTIIVENPETQFVLVEYEYELASWVIELSNVTQDTAANVKSLLA